MSVLYLHIGSHKTGTSAIQKYLFNHQDDLKSKNFSFFTELPNGQKSLTGNTSKWVVVSEEMFEKKLGGVLVNAQRLFPLMRSLSDRVIMSAEDFSWIFSKTELERIKNEALKSFDQVKVIAYIRRQDEQIISHFQQSSNNSAQISAIFYKGGARSLPKNLEKIDLYLGYERRIGNWLDVFGDENVDVRIFEKNRLIDQNVVADFCDVLGISFTGNKEIVNSSRGFYRTKLGHIINEVLSYPIGFFIKENAPLNRTMLPSRSEISEFYKRFEQSNERLAKRLGFQNAEELFSSDFSQYPIDPQDCWDEETTNIALRSVFKSVEDLYGSFNHLDFRDAALAFECEDLKRSYRFMLTAHRLKPDGRFILDKLAEYEMKIIGRELTAEERKSL